MENHLEFLKTQTVIQFMRENHISKLDIGITNKGKYCILSGSTIIGAVAASFHPENNPIKDPQVSLVKGKDGESFNLLHDNNSKITVVHSFTC